MEINHIYASEADMLNMALFGITAKRWRDAHPNAVGNVRDAATLEQLVVACLPKRLCISLI